MDVRCDHDRLIITIIISPVFQPGYLSSVLNEHTESDTQTVVLDVRHVAMMHSPMLGELVQSYIHLQKRGIDLRVIHVNKTNAKLFRYTRLHELITIETTPP